jgi:hypothetical protein
VERVGGGAALELGDVVARLRRPVGELADVVEPLLLSVGRESVRDLPVSRVVAEVVRVGAGVAVLLESLGRDTDDVGPLLEGDHLVLGFGCRPIVEGDDHAVTDQCLCLGDGHRGVALVVQDDQL